MTDGLRVGIAQWTPDSDPGVNLRTAESALRELGRRGCRLAVLPELWLCGYRTVTLGPDARAAAEPIDGPIQRRLAALARTTGMILCAGTFPETARSLRHAGAGLVLHPSAYEAAAQTWWDTIYPAQALCNGQWWIAANQHGGAGPDRMLGGSRVIAPDGRTVASAPRHRDLVPVPELLVADLAVHDELAA